MDRTGHENVSFFIGTEVEHSPAYGAKTLFVVGLQDLNTILTLSDKHGCKHIYLGANQSFNPIDTNDIDEWIEFVTAVVTNTEKKVTFDFDIKYYQDIRFSILNVFSNFIPMISIKLPDVTKLNKNAVLKLDDIDFEATNPGVWCHMVQNLKNHLNFTDWSKYTKDVTINEKIDNLY